MNITNNILSPLNALANKTDPELGAALVGLYNANIKSFIDLQRLNFKTRNAALECKFIKSGDLIYIEECFEGGGGGGKWQAVTAASVSINNYNTLICSGVDKVAISLQEEKPSSKQLGALASGKVSDKAVLDFMFSNYQRSIISAGTYPEYEIKDPNIYIEFEDNAVFKITSGTIVEGDVEPVPALKISGSNVIVKGDVCVDGNLNNNASTTLDTSRRIGALHLAGDDINFNDTVTINNAYFVSFSAGTTDEKADRFTIKKLDVNNSRMYATSIWDAADYSIDLITVKSGPDSIDDRIRTGSQTSTPEIKSKNGTVGKINSTGSVVIEANSSNLGFGQIICSSLKTEDSSSITIASVQASNAVGETFSFAMLSCEATVIGTVIIDGHAGSAGKAAAFANLINCEIDTIIIKNTQGTEDDLEIRGAAGLVINTVICTSHDGTGRGFVFDYDEGYGKQENIRIGNIISSGHVGLDIDVQRPDLADIVIKSINKDATSNVEYLKNASLYEEGFTEVSMQCAIGSVTLKSNQNRLAYTKVGRLVTVTGRIQVESVSNPSGVLSLSNLPYPVFDNANEQESEVGFYVFSAVMSNEFVDGQIRGQLTGGSSLISLSNSNGNSEDGTIGNYMKANSLLLFNFSYFTELSSL